MSKVCFWNSTLRAHFKIWKFKSSCPCTTDFSWTSKKNAFGFFQVNLKFREFSWEFLPAFHISFTIYSAETILHALVSSFHEQLTISICVCSSTPIAKFCLQLCNGLFQFYQWWMSSGVFMTDRLGIGGCFVCACLFLPRIYFDFNAIEC